MSNAKGSQLCRSKDKQGFKNRMCNNYRENMKERTEAPREPLQLNFSC